VVSEFPELASTFYFARQDSKAPMALMNIISSNINQWTLLVAMLPLVFSISAGTVSAIDFDAEQRAELLLTIAQGTVALAFLLNMRLEWWEASALLVFYLAQALFANTSSQISSVAFLARHMRTWITFVYFIWAAASVVMTVFRHGVPPAFRSLNNTWNKHVLKVSS
jgi:cation:H+ antiporter